MRNCGLVPISPLTAAAPGAEEVFAEQLFGAWYARSTGLGDLVPEPYARRSLQTIFQRNCQVHNRGLQRGD